MFEVASRPRSGEHELETADALPAPAMSSHQCRMARAGLQWSQTDLALAARVTQGTVSLFESGGGCGRATLQAMQAALEAAGVTFIAPGETSLPAGPGVRLSDQSH